MLTGTRETRVRGKTLSKGTQRTGHQSFLLRLLGYGTSLNMCRRHKTTTGDRCLLTLFRVDLNRTHTVFSTDTFRL